MHPIAGTVQRRPHCLAHSAIWLTDASDQLYLLSLLSLLSRPWPLRTSETNGKIVEDLRLSPVNSGPKIMTQTANFAGLFILAVSALLGSSSLAQQVQLVERQPDPHGSPRPARNARDVPIKTSFYLELGMPAQANTGDASPESVSVSLKEQGGGVVALLQSGRQFAPDAAGWLRPKQDQQGAKSLAVYIEPGRPLQSATKYTVVVSAGALNQKVSSATIGTWSFTTESIRAVHAQEFSLDLKSEPIHW
jgi:hypothetical protein